MRTKKIPSSITFLKQAFIIKLQQSRERLSKEALLGLVIREGDATNPTGSPFCLLLQSKAAWSERKAPRGTATARWGGSLKGWPCLRPLEERKRQSQRERERGTEKVRLWALAVKTDRLLVKSSTFTCSDEHWLKYS